LVQPVDDTDIVDTSDSGIDDIEREDDTDNTADGVDFHADIILQSVTGQAEVLWRNNTEGSDVFKDPLFFSDRAWLSERQTKPQPTLLMSKRDWEVVYHRAHEGAFGSDYDIWTSETTRSLILSKYTRLGHGDWVVVWKFPADLNRIPGYKTIYDVPLPVGSYPFRCDKWYPVPHIIDPAMPINQVMVEKCRYDLTVYFNSTNCS
jgi:hypothetical protein